MKGIEEKLYLEIVLACENPDCSELYKPDVEAIDPMELWAKRNAELALAKGWKVGKENETLCPLCSEGG